MYLTSRSGAIFNLLNNAIDVSDRMKDLESKLAERDAMIRVLQKHTYDKADSSSSSGVGSYPAAHSSHSSTSADHHTALTSTPELGKEKPWWIRRFKFDHDNPSIIFFHESCHL